MKFEWESINLMTLRAKVFGGWILSNMLYVNGNESLCFIPDKNHEWKIDEEEAVNE